MFCIVGKEVTVYALQTEYSVIVKQLFYMGQYPIFKVSVLKTAFSPYIECS